MERITTKAFDMAEHLRTDVDISEFLQEVADTGSSSDFIHALGVAARAKGMSNVAKQAGVTRASLYKSLSANGQPRFATIIKVVAALGCQLKIVAQ